MLGNDWVVRRENRLCQAEAQSRHHAPAKSTVIVCAWEDGAVEIRYCGRKLNWYEIEQLPTAPRVSKQKRGKPSPPAARRMPDYPWRIGY